MVKTSLVLTVIGRDRPGIVALMSQTLVAHGANWEESHMARLAGRFAGILCLGVPKDQVESLTMALKELAKEGLTVVVEGAGSDPWPEDWPLLGLALTGSDHEGIVQDVTRALKERAVSIETINTERVSAPWSGGMMFKAVARLRAPPDLPLQILRTDLESIADDLAVEITLEPAADT